MHKGATFVPLVSLWFKLTASCGKSFFREIVWRLCYTDRL